MSQFDLGGMGAGLFDPNNGFTQFNQYLHSNPFYNGFQAVMTAMSIFTAGAWSTMKCFVAGTIVLTATGSRVIEDIRAGDKVISASEEDFKVKEKRVVETYIRETRELIHLTINGERVSTTYTHPFYVKERGFVEAGELEVGEELYDAKGNVLYVEETKRELLNEPVKVYNFQVEDYHTYHVGNNGILVHNAGDGYKGANQVTNPGKNESPVWKKLEKVKGLARKFTGKGRNKKFYEWDHTHNDIEVYDHLGRHLGSMDPTTGEMYKPAVPGRTIKVN